MPTKFTKLMLFLSSYLPLLVIIGVTHRQTWGPYWLVPIFIGATSLLWLIAWILWVSSFGALDIGVCKSRAKDSDVVAYIVSYVLPLAGENLSNFDSAFTMGTFFLILMTLNLNSNLVYINPILNLMGFHLFEVELDSGNEVMLITRRDRLLVGQKIQARKAAEAIYLEK